MILFVTPLDPLETFTVVHRYVYLPRIILNARTNVRRLIPMIRCIRVRPTMCRN